MTLIEILVAVAIMLMLFAAAAPNLSSWIQNTKIRSTSESIQNGLALARSEAVHRNTVSQFVSCGGSAWNVLATSATASASVCGGAAVAGWELVQARPAGLDNALVASTQSTIGFNGLGRQVTTTDLVSGNATSNPPATVDLNVSTTLAGAACTCATGNCNYPADISYSASGKLRCLRVSVSQGGQVRLCDPALPASSPQGC